MDRLRVSLYSSVQDVLFLVCRNVDLTEVSQVWTFFKHGLTSSLHKILHVGEDI